MSLRQKNTGVRLREILPQCNFDSDRDVRVGSCTSDPEACEPGKLYVAIESPDFDGHNFVQQALRRGAAAVVAERHLPIDVPLCVVPDSREAFGAICHRLAGSPSRHLCTVGVTGTNGKTTTSLLTASILNAAGHRTGVMSDLAYDDSRESVAGQQSNASPAELAGWLQRMQNNDCSHAVVETSSRALARRCTAGLELDAAVLTNLRRDHMDYHGSLVNYRRAKARLLQHLKPGGFIVANADDPASRALIRKTEHPALTVGMRMEAELQATVVDRHAGEQTFLLSAGSETVAVQTPLFGDHHVYNCLSAAAVGLVMGIDLTTVARGLEAVTWITGRMEPVGFGHPFGIYVDDAHTPDALAMTLKALRQVTRGRVYCVFGADADRDESIRPLLGRVVERSADFGVITNDNPRHAQPLQIAHDIIDGYDRPSNAHVLPDRAEAIRWVLGQARPGDAVLIAGKGHRQGQIIGEQTHAYDDRAVARQWLEEVGSQIEYDEPQRPMILQFASQTPAFN